MTLEQQTANLGEHLWGTLEMRGGRGNRVDNVQEAAEIWIHGNTLSASTTDAQLSRWAHEHEADDRSTSRKMGYELTYEPSFEEYYRELREYCRENTLDT